MWEIDDPNSIEKQVAKIVEGRGRQKDTEFRPSKPPGTPEDRELLKIFKKLKAKQHNLNEKRRIANEVLTGKHGVKKQIHAKLMLGPRDFESVVNDPRDIVPELIELAGNNDVDVRVKAAKVLGKRGDERALLALSAGLGEEAYWAKYEFTAALGKVLRNIGEGLEDPDRAEGVLKGLHDAEIVLSELVKMGKGGEKACEFLRGVRKKSEEVGLLLGRPELARRGEKAAFVKVVELAGASRGEKTQPMRVGRPGRPDTTQRIGLPVKK